MTESTNPKISSLLRYLTLVEVLVLFITGLGLFFAPKIIEPFWPWKLLPFNARFLGAVYSASLVAAAMQVWYGRWSPTRVVTPMIFVFTAIIFALSFVYIEQFDFKRMEVWLWFLLYGIFPINAGYHLWLYRNLPPADSTQPSATGRTILIVQSILLGLFGLALLIAPSFAKAFWSWEIDEFHAQLYSVTFITPAIGSFLLAKAASKTEWLTMGWTQGVLGLFPIIGVIVVDATVKRVNWSLAGTWIWMALFAAIFIVSMWMIKKIPKVNKMSAINNLSQTLEQWTRWMRLQRALTWFLRGLALALALSLLIGGMGLYQAKLLKQEFLALVASLTALLPVLFSIAAYLWNIQPIKAARFFDRAFHLEERVSTALELQAENHAIEIIQKQLDDAVTATHGVKPSRDLPLRFKKVDGLLALIFALLIGVLWFRGETLFAAASQQRAVEEAIAAQQTQIEEIIKEINANEALTDEQKQALAKPLEEALSGLEDNPSMEGAVSTLVSTSEKLQAMSSEQAGQSMQALKETGSSLASQEGSPLESVGKDLANGNFANKASDLANMDLSQMNSAEWQQLAEQLESMASELASTNPQLAQELTSAAQALRRGDIASAQQSLSNAAEQLAQAGQQISASQMAGQAAGQLQQGAGQVLAAGGGQPSQGNASAQGQSNQQSGQNNGGSGSGSGSGSAPPSNQAGSEAGSSPIPQNNGAGDGGESAYEQIYAPSLLGGAGEDTLGLPTSGEEGDVVGTSPTTAEDGESLVPYTEVYSQYNQFNRRAVENGEVPAQFMDVIRNYFDSLQP